MPPINSAQTILAKINWKLIYFFNIWFVLNFLGPVLIADPIFFFFFWKSDNFAIYALWFLLGRWKMKYPFFQKWKMKYPSMIAHFFMFLLSFFLYVCLFVEYWKRAIATLFWTTLLCLDCWQITLEILSVSNFNKIG